MILLRYVPNVVEIRDEWKLYTEASGVMIRINTLTIMPPATIYSFHPPLISTNTGNLYQHDHN
jgi:hypothetical protein